MSIKRKTLALPAKHEMQLELCLVFSEPAKVIPFKPPPKLLDDLDKPNSYVWDEWAVDRLRERLLIGTLKSLTDGRATIAKLEALEWLMSEEVAPFSFRVCAEAAGVHYEQVRARTLAIMKTTEQALEQGMLHKQ